jgi:hypothetical protein
MLTQNLRERSLPRMFVQSAFPFTKDNNLVGGNQVPTEREREIQGGLNSPLSLYLHVSHMYPAKQSMILLECTAESGLALCTLEPASLGPRSTGAHNIPRYWA